MDRKKKEKNVKNDIELDANDMKQIVDEYKKIFAQ